MAEFGPAQCVREAQGIGACADGRRAKVVLATFAVTKVARRRRKLLTFKALACTNSNRYTRRNAKKH